MGIMSLKYSTEFDQKATAAGSVEKIAAVYRNGELRELRISNDEKRTEEAYIRSSSPSEEKPFGTFLFIGSYPGKEEKMDKINPVSAKDGFRKALLTGDSPQAVKKQYGVHIQTERWYKVGVNFETGGPIYLDFETGRKEGLARDKETEKKKRDTRKLLRTASGRFIVE